MLALIGSGEYLPPMESVDRQLLSLLPEPARVVCLPIAAGTEGTEVIQGWMQRGVDHFTRLGADAQAVPVVDRKSADDAELAARIATANFVYLSGGKPAYLAATLRGSRTWQAILDVIASGGLLAGCSAGAMVQGGYFAGFPRRQVGFGLWPNVHIIPHFDEMPGPAVAMMRWLVGRGVTVVGVPGNTALVHHHKGYQVIGQEVTVWTRRHRRQLPAGPLADDLLE